MKQIERIKIIAIKIRKAMEEFATKYHEIGNADDLACYCAIASHALNNAFKKNGIKSRVVIGFYDEGGLRRYSEIDNDTEKNHCWVEVPFHYVDITATQFHIDEKVHITDNRYSDKYGYYPLEYFKSIKKMKRNWGNQAPDRQYTKEILKLAGI